MFASDRKAELEAERQAELEAAREAKAKASRRGCRGRAAHSGHRPNSSTVWPTR